MALIKISHDELVSLGFEYPSKFSSRWHKKGIRCAVCCFKNKKDCILEKWNIGCPGGPMVNPNGVDRAAVKEYSIVISVHG